VLLLFSQAAFSQFKIDSAAFFRDQQPFDMTLSSDLKTFINKKMQKAEQPALVTMRFPDSSKVSEEIGISSRGKFRLENCHMPPIRLNFTTPSSPGLKNLGKLKLVVGCGATKDDEQLIIKEYLAYKIYNMLTEKSFRVRLVKITYDDTKGKIKSYSQYGFLLEDVDDMAKRNGCRELENVAVNSETTDRKQMTLVALFEYMIGNTDWSVPAFHNIKLIQPRKDEKAIPIAVPYDLNHSGFVNASYAAPPEEMGIETVKDRKYRGFPRSMEELQEAISIFNNQKENIFNLVSNCEWLNKPHKKEVTLFLEDFYKTINNKNAVKHTFIDNARTE
jgi:hypothetical protein